MGNLVNWLWPVCDGIVAAGLQEALYFLIAHVLSRSAVNHVTLAVQKQLDTHRLAVIDKTPAILIVDGVWVEIQYTCDEFKEDRSGQST